MIATTETLVVAVVAVLLARLVLSYLHFRKLELAIPGPATLPLLGNALDFMRSKPDEVVTTLKKLKGDNAGTYRFSIFNHLSVIMCEPDHVDEVARNKDFNDKSFTFYNLLEGQAKKGLVLLGGAEWRLHRKWLAPGFNKNTMNSFVEIFREEAKGFVERVVPDTEMDTTRCVRLTSMRNFMRTSLAEDCSEYESAMVNSLEFVDLFMAVINRRVFNPVLWSDRVFGLLPIGRRVKVEKEKIEALTKAVCQKKRDELKARNDNEAKCDNEKARKTLMDIMMDPSAVGIMPEEDILDEVKTFFFANVETTVSALNWLLKTLSLEPEVQEKAYAEVLDVLGDRDVTWEDLPKLTYVDRVIKECMRMFPPLPFTARQCYKETELFGHTIPAGTTLGLGIYFLHRNPDHWPQPDVFDPDRFLPENVKGRHRSAYLPFSVGPRNCIGSRYAMMNITTFLAVTLRAYKVLPVDDHKDLRSLADNFTFDLTSRLVGGNRVRFQRREVAAA